MDTKALRQKILDLAIRGKLVPQDPNDEPASVLLERIREQKQQMVKEGKLKKKDIKNDSVIFVGEDNLHYEKFPDSSVKCIEDEIPFDVPEGWAWCHYADVIELYSGQDLTPNRYNDIGEGIPYITGASNLEHGKVIINRWTTTPTTHATIGDLLLTVKGSGVGKMAFCDIIDAHIARQIMALRCTNAITPQYLYIAISAMLSDITAQANGIIPGIRREIVLGAYLPLPPLSEQEKICKSTDNSLHIIDDIDSNKGDLKEIIQITKSKILDLAIRGRLVPQSPDDEPASVLLEHIRAEKEELIKQGKIKRDKKESVIFRGEDNSYYEKFSDGKCRSIEDELPFELPDGWEWCNLSMIGTTNIGLTYRPTDIDPTGTMVLRSNNIVDDEIDLNDLVRVKTKIRENQYVQPNDILICARNGSKALVGKCALIDELKEPASFGAFMAVYKTDYYKYVLHYLRSSQFRNVFDDGNSTAINQLTQDMLKRALIPFPPISEQERIVNRISELLSRLRDIEKSLS
ncbi:MAG: restriction endonuclease subunit S [Eubacteriales bacterium]|nr:restriction endonuclease subunit S [Eubacteriales bacterium]